MNSDLMSKVMGAGHHEKGTYLRQPPERIVLSAFASRVLGRADQDLSVDIHHASLQKLMFCDSVDLVSIGGVSRSS